MTARAVVEQDRGDVLREGGHFRGAGPGGEAVTDADEGDEQAQRVLHAISLGLPKRVSLVGYG